MAACVSHVVTWHVSGGTAARATDLSFYPCAIFLSSRALKCFFFNFVETKHTIVKGALSELPCLFFEVRFLFVALAGLNSPCRLG